MYFIFYSSCTIQCDIYHRNQMYWEPDLCRPWQVVHSTRPQWDVWPDLEFWWPPGAGWNNHCLPDSFRFLDSTSKGGWPVKDVPMVSDSAWCSYAGHQIRPQKSCLYVNFFVISMSVFFSWVSEGMLFLKGKLTN